MFRVSGQYRLNCLFLLNRRNVAHHYSHGLAVGIKRRKERHRIRSRAIGDQICVHSEERRAVSALNWVEFSYLLVKIFELRG